MGPVDSERRMARSYYEVFETAPAGSEEEVGSQVSWESNGSQWNGWDRSESWSSPWHRNSYGWGWYNDYDSRSRFSEMRTGHGMVQAWPP